MYMCMVYLRFPCTQYVWSIENSPRFFLINTATAVIRTWSSGGKATFGKKTSLMKQRVSGKKKLLWPIRDLNKKNQKKEQKTHCQYPGPMITRNIQNISGRLKYFFCVGHESCLLAIASWERKLMENWDIFRRLRWLVCGKNGVFMVIGV